MKIRFNKNYLLKNLVIRRRLDTNNLDEALKGCWSCLWNVTDETPVNSERFIQQDGVDLFLRCLKQFPEDNDLKRNIMGLVGKILK
jgi:Zyg-11 family protein